MAEPSLDDTGQQAFERNEANNQWLSKIGQTWPARAAMSALEAFKLPGQVYSGEVQLRGEDGNLNAPAVDKIAELASMISGGSFAMPAVKGGAGMGIRAYHVSPYDFDRFDLSKIGTGEGVQAYGHGLYYAESPQVSGKGGAYWNSFARSMADDALDAGRTVESGAIDALYRSGGDVEKAIAELRKHAETFKDTAPEFAEAARRLEAGEHFGPRVYEVDINAHPDQFLEFGVNLNKQTPEVKEALRNAGVYQRGPYVSAEVAYQNLADAGTIADGVMGRQAAASQALREAGIPGIKYLDQGSRAAGDGSRNYVVFDDKIVNILRKYGIAAGATTPPAFSALAEFMAQGQPQGEQ